MTAAASFPPKKKLSETPCQPRVLCAYVRACVRACVCAHVCVPLRRCRQQWTDWLGRDLGRLLDVAEVGLLGAGEVQGDWAQRRSKATACSGGWATRRSGGPRLLGAAEVGLLGAAEVGLLGAGEVQGYWAQGRLGY